MLARFDPGHVFGGDAPAPQTFSGRVEAAGLVASGNSVFFGPVTWKIANSGALTASGTSVPGGRVSRFQASGSFSTTGVSLSYRVTASGGSTATGTVVGSKH